MLTKQHLNFMEQNKNMTAVEWLYNMMLKPLSEWPDDLWEQAKEMEKEQHGETWLDSTMQFDNAAEMTYKKDFEQYYNEKYGISQEK